jgi:CTP synthase (UTP-ammonia lyase)
VRQFRKEKGTGETVLIHVSLVPYIAAAHEIKTKPTQHSVKELRSMGLQPDFIVCRSDHEINDNVRAKIALFCDVAPEEVLSNVDLPSIYDVPMALYEQKLDEKVLEKLNLPLTDIDLTSWTDFVTASHEVRDEVDIAVVGKYVSLPDAYLSIHEALVHAGIACGRKVNVHIVQCDCEVRKDVKITETADIDESFGEFKARGFGGTDFRPVFQHTERMRKGGVFTDLRGLIYFTDGLGIFPEKEPSFKTAFIIMPQEDDIPQIPDWAIGRMVSRDDLEE